MHIKKRYLLIAASVVILLFYFRYMNIKWTEEKETQQFNMNLQKLKEVTKLVIWEQDFTLNDVETKEKKRLFWFDSKESVATTIKGKMGFHIDLSDSINTHITRTNDTLFIQAPLRITYVSLDLGSLQQVKESSLDPTINVSKEEVVKHLSQRALASFLPAVIETIKTRDLSMQQRQLSKLVGKPVILSFSRMPVAADWEQ